MRSNSTGLRPWLRSIALTGLILAGCESAGPTTADRPEPKAGSSQSPPRGDAVAIIGDRSVRFSQLRPLLIEAAGGDVLSEVVLDHQLAVELSSHNLTVTEQDTQRERAILLRQLSPDGDQAARLLGQLRERLGLGPRRFTMFLRRYAALRKLIAGEVQVTEPLVRRAYEEQYSPQVECRMILVPTLTQASEVLRRVRAGESFTDLAIELSEDESRNQGGLLPPISPFDTSFPSAITTAASKLAKGQVSDPIALDNGFAILRCERKITVAPPPFEQVSGDLRDLVRLRQERSLMQRRARILMDRANATVLDPDLDREFKKSRTQVVEP